jgi:hypothetical protein
VKLTRLGHVGVVLPEYRVELGEAAEGGRTEAGGVESLDAEDA